MPTLQPLKTRIANATLTVSDLKRALAFYTKVLGFYAHQNAHNAELSVQPDGPALLTLTEHTGAQPKPRHTTGLFHIAIRVPNRIALAQIMRRLHDRQWPLGGASDHGVSEALYLSDPDGNGLEIYTDLPQDQWPTQGEKVAMYSAPLDVQKLFQEAADRNDTHLPDSTDIGHIHLQVSSLEQAKHFYCDLLGFDIRQDNYRGALFVAADGYHHHLGLNTWAGEGVPNPPANAVGLASFTLLLPGKEALHEVAERLTEAGFSTEMRPDHLITQDQDNNTVILTHMDNVS